MRRRLVFLIISTVLLAGVFSGCSEKAATASSKTSVSKVTRGNLQVGLSADGSIALPVTNLDFSVEGTIKHIYVAAGDMVVKGQLLAELDDTDLQLALTNANNTLDKANLSYDDAIKTADYNLVNELKNLESLELKLNTAFDDYTYQQSIKDAELNLSRKQKDLDDAVKDAEAEFDDYTYQLTIKDAQTNLERKKKELEDAEAKLAADFDDYTYQLTIKDAQTNLDRKKSDLADAEKTLIEAQNKELAEVDEYSYQYTINNAQTALNRKKDDLKEAETALKEAESQTYSAMDNTSYINAIDTALTNEYRKEAEYDNALSSGDANAIQTALIALQDAQKAVDTAYSNYYNALRKYDTDNDDKKAAAVVSAQKTVNNAKLSVTDAETSLKKAQDDLEKAKADKLKSETESKAAAIENAEAKVKSAKQSVTDAESSLTNAENNLKRALKSDGESNADKAASSRRTVEDAENTLANALMNLERAKKSSYDNAQTKLASAIQARDDAAASLENAKTNLTRAKNNYQSDYLSTKNSYELQKLKVENQMNSSTTITNAKLAIGDAELKVSEAETNLAKSKLTSPIDGKILSISSKVGETVAGRNSGPVINFGTGTTGFITVCDVTQIYFTTSVTEGDIVGIYEGQVIKATVDSLGDENIGATVYSVSSIPTTDSSGIVTYKVVGLLDEYNKDLKDGMSAFLTFIKKEKENVLQIPVRAVFMENNKQYVHVETSSGIYEKREVVCGLSNGTQTELVSGLEEGQVVVVGSIKK